MSTDGPKSNLFLRIVLSIFALCVASFVVDLSLARWVDGIVLARNADFEQRLETASLDFRNGDGWSCRQRVILKVYRYQTCLIFEKSMERKEIVRPTGLKGKGYFRYVYQRPSSFLLGQNRKDVYRFEARSLGLELMIVNSDGSLMDVFEGNN